MTVAIIAGRTCPLSYRYQPSVFNRPAEISAETIYVIGGLYGNPFALAKIIEMAALEPVRPILIFNGDFNWFNRDATSFKHINEEVLQHCATRGNVETELADDASDVGCGCAYPEDVPATEVARSNEIMDILRSTSAQFPALRQRLAALPMHLVAAVGSVKIAITHGDAESLAGWGFSRESLRNADALLKQYFAAANVSIFACTHTCLPASKRVVLEQGDGLVINNGSAGMANGQGETCGLITRISLNKSLQKSQFHAQIQGLNVDLLSVDFAISDWENSFLENWPLGSPAHTSYYRRIMQGPIHC
jgi:hypothetical protein